MNRSPVRFAPGAIAIVTMIAAALAPGSSATAATRRGLPIPIEIKRAYLARSAAEVLERMEALEDGDDVAEPAREPGEAPMFAPGPRRATLFAPTATTTIPTNSLVNDKLGDPIASAQCEPSLAMLGPFGFCAFNTDPGPHGGDGIAAAFTMTEGMPWMPLVLPKPAGASYIADPVTAVDDKSFTFYFAGLVSGPAGEGISVLHGHPVGGPVGISWDPPVLVRAGIPPAILFDKEWIAADPGSGNLYLTYTSFGSGTDTILFQRSLDHGITWSSPLTIAAATPALVQGSRVAVGPDGEVYVAWFRAATPADSMLIRKSTDHGLTFGPRALIAAVFSDYGTGGAGSNLSYAPNFPSIAVDRTSGEHHGRVYAAWAGAVNYADDVLGAGPSLSEKDPTGGVLHAGAFVPGMKLRGFLTGPSDVDTWSFMPSSGHTYVFTVDSLKAAFGMKLYVVAPDTTIALTYSSVPTGIGSGKPNTTIWTMPAFAPGGPYYLKLVPAGGSPGGYKLETGDDGVAAPGIDHPGDARDAMVAYSDGGSAWSVPNRVTMDPSGIEQVMPEVGVSVEGYPYTLYLDYLMPPFGAGTMAFTSRSINGGVTWEPEMPVGTAPSPWWMTLSDIVPDQGDYLGITATFGAMGYVFTDSRGGDPDIYMAPLHVATSIACPAESSWTNRSTHTVHFGVTSASEMFVNGYTYTLKSQRDWAGLPASGAVSVGPMGMTGVDVSVTVPDSAADGTNLFTVVVTQTGGAVVESCTVSEHVMHVLAVGPGETAKSRLALGRPWPNPSSGALHVEYSLASSEPLTLELVDIAGRRVLARELGAQNPGSHTLSLGRDIDGLPAGVYAVRLRQGTSCATSRIAIVR